MIKLDLTGQKFGRLTALYDSGKRKRSFKIWVCHCDCGNFAEARSAYLKNGNTKSCGCLQKENRKTASYTHGDSYTRLYKTWVNMKTRCYQNSHKDSHRYKEKGIIVCPEWRDSYQAFKFWAILSGYQDDLTIDRIDEDGNYEPDNCQWMTKSENVQKYWRNYNATQ